MVGLGVVAHRHRLPWVPEIAFTAVPLMPKVKKNYKKLSLQQLTNSQFSSHSPPCPTHTIKISTILSKAIWQYLDWVISNPFCIIAPAKHTLGAPGRCIIGIPESKLCIPKKHKCQTWIFQNWCGKILVPKMVTQNNGNLPYLKAEILPYL